MIPRHERPTPETDAFIGDQDEECMTEGEIALCKFTRELEQKAAEQIEELNQRLIDRDKSIVIQASKIDETWREKLAKKDAQVVALREAVLTNHNKWEQRECKCDLNRTDPHCHRCYCVEMNRAVLSTPPPPVVPLAELQPFLQAVKDYAEFHGGCGHHPEDCPQEAEECKIVASFNRAQLAFFRKHPSAWLKH